MGLGFGNGGSRAGCTGLHEPAAIGRAERGSPRRGRVSGQGRGYATASSGDEEPAAQQFVTSVRDGRPIYKYADPLVCRCVYFGTQQNWDVYRHEVFAQQLANEAQMTAMMNQEAWDWGPWGWP